MAINGKPFQAFPGQDHKAHIDAHLSFMSISMVQNNPCSDDGIDKKTYLNTFHLMAQEQIQLEFVEEIQEMQMIQQQMGPMMQNPMMMHAKSTSNADGTTCSTDNFTDRIYEKRS